MKTIEFNVDEETGRLVGRRAKALGFADPGAYLLHLIRGDLALATKERRERLSEILATLQAHAEATGISEEELARDIKEARNEVFAANKCAT